MTNRIFSIGYNDEATHYLIYGLDDQISLEIVYETLNLISKARTDLREQGYYDERNPS